MDFNQKIERKETYSVKWDRTEAVFNTKEQILPMWVADMDFRPPEGVLNALKERLDHGIFGYTYVADDVTDTVRNWLMHRHGWDVERGWISYSTGVVPSLGKTVLAFTDPGDKVLIQSPVYPPFFSMVKENGREVENCQLEETSEGYCIDFTAFEEAAAKPDVKLFFLCSPHNPVGRVWTKDELTQLADICLAHKVIIVADEIHSDLILEGYSHIPMASLSEDISHQTVTLSAPSKTFNLAGMQASFVIAANPDHRKKLGAVDKQQGHFTLNTMGILAMKAAYDHGEDWLNELNDYIKANADFVADELERLELPIHLARLEATYLLWLDCRELGLTDKELEKLFINAGKIGFNWGHTFGAGGEGFVRMNVACPRETVEKGIQRIQQAMASLEAASTNE
ncbi:MalY/PatB family protein [Salisediminibacterium beveridgei]|uniref:cysteine-S-conjugate beta-lyase n=1 Tax=Salisediminibacterium beveridgei TaxID=632773 RepID=A0A1D7QYX7_9BACI|nr:PatB family C-S lyase [Salisediminibacterium beveridgei]AOM84209.1 cystathionine beta-lyase [Salisediminibacterium beveridgei]